MSNEPIITNDPTAREPNGCPFETFVGDDGQVMVNDCLIGMKSVGSKKWYEYRPQRKGESVKPFSMTVTITYGDVPYTAEVTDKIVSTIDIDDVVRSLALTLASAFSQQDAPRARDGGGKIVGETEFQAGGVSEADEVGK